MISVITNEIKERFGNPLDGLEKGSGEYITEFNKFCRQYEALLVKHIFTAGATWAGILAHDDSRSVDYLLTRDDVDASRIGCCGLSLGGYRAALLAGTDPRVACTVAAGWMPTLQSLLHSHLRDHTYMVYVPGLGRHMEFPDVASITAPNPLFIQQCREDWLYSPEGMQNACEIIQSVYEKAKAPERFKYAFYDNSHEFNILMQEEAFLWLDEFLL